MDKAILKKFAVESRQDLMDKIRNKIKTFYIDEDFNSEQKGEVYVLSNEKHSLSLTNDEFKKRELLIKRVRELSLEQVIEEAAYTWFNRIIAIRYMEINDMLPLTKDNQSLGIRVLSSKDNTPDPEILKFTNLMNPELDIDFKKEKYIEFKDENDKFKYILLLICKKLGRVIPQVFDGVTDYIDILVPDNLLNDTGFITKVVSEIPEDNFNKVEIIGWLYQYYNQLEKDRVISSKKTYKKNEIAYATQLFTPDWIVKYMVENSLGSYWMEHSENDQALNRWKYYIKNDYKITDIKNPCNITFFDPCCGSGHILVYAFEIFYQMYLQVGYNKNDIPELILKNNLYGLDIDDRAGQLSILSVLLKAREIDKNIFNKNIANDLNIMSIQDSNSISEKIIDNIQTPENREYAKYLIDSFKNAKEIGSLLLFENKDYSGLEKEIQNDSTIFGIELRDKIFPLIKIGNMLSKKYDIVVTNPPYVNSNFMSKSLKEYILCNYKDFKYDLFSAFIVRNNLLTKENGKLGFMTPYVWMFITSYENLRKYLIDNVCITSLIQFEYSAFEEATVPICTFTLKKTKSNDLGNYYRLVDFKGGMKIQEQKFLELNESNRCYKKNQFDYNRIPGCPIVYWLSENMFNVFKNGLPLYKFGDTRQGMATSDVNRFTRFWYEVNRSIIGFNYKTLDATKDGVHKWFPYIKGGKFRKWSGNYDTVVNWQFDGKEVKDYAAKLYKSYTRTIKNIGYYLKECISWGMITSSDISVRYYGSGYIFDIAGCCLFAEHKYLMYLLAFLNTNIARELTKAINPTINMNVGDIANLPIIYDEKYNKEIEEIVKNNISSSKYDWDTFETSWDFKKHPLISYATLTPQQVKKEQDSGFQVCNNLMEAYNHWENTTNEKFKELKENEEKLNEIFIKIYGLEKEMSKEIEDKNITVRLADKERDIKSLISYAVGCMFGRYSLDKDGLIYAGGDFDKVYQKCKKTDGGWAGSSLSNYKYLNDNENEIELSFEVDNDNIIPITDEAYFSDDIVERFKTFIKTVYGDNTFNENMDFIAEALGKKGTETSEETIRRYFVNDFFNDHVKMYQKRPIYWLLDSGKKNGFKALIYMHRYNENLIPKARLDYLHRVQTTYEKLLSDVNYRLTTELSMIDKKEAKNRQADLNAKLNEIKEYDEKIAHIANQRISIDLDDGVKVNYEKFKDILAKIK